LQELVSEEPGSGAAPGARGTMRSRELRSALRNKGAGTMKPRR
jgi:hypothetical protein